jgi:hypothetical protein
MFSLPLAIEMQQSAGEAGSMNINQAKWFLRVFANGKKLNTLTIRDLYLSGYLGIELRSAGKEPLPTVITEKGKRVLETASRHFIPLRDSAEPGLPFST